MLIGQLLAYASMMEGKNVSWLPSYGPEMRGGTANCNTIISDQSIGSPVITNDATDAVIMNLPSLHKFEKSLIKGGNIFINSSLIKEKITRQDIKPYYIPANEIALSLKNNKIANIAILGAFIKITELVKPKTLIEALKKIFGEKKLHLIEINEKALNLGMDSLSTQT